MDFVFPFPLLTCETLVLPASGFGACFPSGHQHYFIILVIPPRQKFSASRGSSIFHLRLFLIFEFCVDILVSITRDDITYTKLPPVPHATSTPERFLVFGSRLYFSRKFSDPGESKASQCSSIHSPGLSVGRGSCLHPDELSERSEK
jgi:hypothetical protein